MCVHVMFHDFSDPAAHDFQTWQLLILSASTRALFLRRRTRLSDHANGPRIPALAAVRGAVPSSRPLREVLFPRRTTFRLVRPILRAPVGCRWSWRLRASCKNLQDTSGSAFPPRVALADVETAPPTSLKPVFLNPSDSHFDDFGQSIARCPDCGTCRLVGCVLGGWLFAATVLAVPIRAQLATQAIAE